MEAKQLIGLDVGKTRTGIARASSVARLAEPLVTVENSRLFSVLDHLIKDYNLKAIVIGLPRNLQGNETTQTEWVRHWVDNARKRISLPFYWQDEALTTKLAEARQLLGGRKLTQGTDALAAAIILQDFLDTPEAERVPC